MKRVLDIKMLQMHDRMENLYKAFCQAEDLDDKFMAMLFKKEMLEKMPEYDRMFNCGHLYAGINMKGDC